MVKGKQTGQELFGEPEGTFADNKIFSVAEFIEILNTFFKREEVRIKGEICELKRAASGHIYFTLKDKGDGDAIAGAGFARNGSGGSAVIDSIIWSRNYQLSGVALEVGMEVVLTGHPNIYPPSGRLSFVADTVELVGEGALKKAYEALRAKLEAEGVFAAARKRPLPEFPHRSGVVTSLKGAVIHDFENNLGKFGFQVLVCDSRVEGQAAVKDLLASIATMREFVAQSGEIGGIDALVIIRGGGSLESLQAFNNEALVRAIVDFPVPVIAGIGHDQDVPLAALAADFMTSTPTAAAHLFNRSWEDAFAKVRNLSAIFVRLQQELKRRATDLDSAWSSLIDQVARRIDWMKEQIDYTERFTRLHDPRRQLKLGYSIVRKNGKILRSVGNVAKGDELETELSDGSVRSRVE
jgi:exodeoxyribonuclease VII large subunit